jgi:hypothetical protein
VTDKCATSVALARELGLDVASFKADMRDACARQVERDTDDFRRLDVLGPSMFVNGRFGLERVTKLEALADAELAKARDRIAAGVPAAEYYERHVMTGVRDVPGAAAIDLRTPDPLETRGLDQRAPALDVVTAQVVGIGWQGSSHHAHAHGRSKADADAIVRTLLALAKRGELDRRLARTLDESGDTLRFVRPAPDGAQVMPIERAARRLNVGEAALVRTSLGWTVVQRITIPPPPDVGAPPANAAYGYNGIRYRILERKPGAYYPRWYSAFDIGDTVYVSYTGWTARGAAFVIDSEGFEINEIPWIQVIGEGEKVRLWFPAGGFRGRWKELGPIVLDLELTSVSKIEM